jgi:hypothetical protein
LRQRYADAFEFRKPNGPYGVENYPAKQVREGKISLEDAQRGIESDWTQLLAASEGCEGDACE